MSKETGIRLICRLCGKEEKYLIDIFSDDGKKQDLEKKIRLCLPITVTLEDAMPRQVCLDCLNKLDAAYDLYIGCIEAQHYIREKLGYSQASVHTVACNGALQSGFLLDSNSISGRSTVTDNSLRSVLGLQRTFSSFVTNEQKRLSDESLQRMVSSQQPHGIQFAHTRTQVLNFGVVAASSSPSFPTFRSTLQSPSSGRSRSSNCYLLSQTQKYINNMSTQMNSSSTNGQLLGTQLDGTSIMLTAANVPMMQATNSPVTGNLQGQLYVSSLSNSGNPAATMTSSSIPVMVSTQCASGSSAQMSISCNKPQYPIQNNLPSSLQIMPIAQVQAGSSDQPPSHFASAVYQAQPTSVSQNGVPLLQIMGSEGQMQPPSSSNIPMARRLLGKATVTTPAGSGALSVVPATTMSSSLFSHIPSPSRSVPVVSAASNAAQMQPPHDRQPNQQNFGDLMHQTVSLWASKQNAAVNMAGSAQSLGGSQTSTSSDLPTLRTSLFTNPEMPQENGCATVPLQPVITQVTSGFQNAAAIYPGQETVIHMDLSNDTDDDMDAEPELNDASDESENKPFSLAIVRSAQVRAPRRRPTNSSTTEECPHCHKEFRSDIIFHHIKLHFRQSFFSCLDCGKNYSSDKALEAHKCPGEIM